MSRPLLPLFLLRLSEESAICLSSTSTNSGITISPSMKPVFIMSAILPSIITLVSRILGAGLLSLDLLFDDVVFLAARIDENRSLLRLEPIIIPTEPKAM